MTTRQFAHTDGDGDSFLAHFYPSNARGMFVAVEVRGTTSTSYVHLDKEAAHRLRDELDTALDEPTTVAEPEKTVGSPEWTVPLGARLGSFYVPDEPRFYGIPERLVLDLIEAAIKDATITLSERPVE